MERQNQATTHETEMKAITGGHGDSWDSILTLASIKSCEQKKYIPNDVIYHEGDQVDKIFVIRGGLVKLLSYLANGRARIVRLHNKNHWFGLEGLMGQTYEHTAIAVNEVDLYQVPVNAIHLLEHENSQLYVQVLRQWYGHLVQADRWISDFSTGGIKPRVARLVDFLSDLEYGKSSATVDLLTVHEMADILGVTPESVSRILAEFKRSDVLNRQKDALSETYDINASKLQLEARK